MDRDRLLEFEDVAVPEGESPWVEGFGPGLDLTIAAHDPRWADDYAELAGLVRQALGEGVDVEHVGSTSVPGLPAKPIIDVVVRMPDSEDEASYVPALEQAGFVLAVREPWWQGHRLFRHGEPRANVHVFGPEAAEPERMRIFRDWLRMHPGDRERYADAKRAAAAQGGHVMEYNARKQDLLREILVRAITQAG